MVFKMLNSKIILYIKKHNFIYFPLKYIKNNTVDIYLNYKRNKVFLEKGREALLIFDKALKEANVNYWLCFGTLLGAVREKSFIKHDLDIDVGVPFQSYGKDIENALIHNGFKKTRHFLIDNGDFGREETYTYKNVSIDVFYFKVINNVTFCHLFDPKDKNNKVLDPHNPAKYAVRELNYPFEGFLEIDFLGGSFNIPSNYKEWLKNDYGENYMIPDPNYKPTSRPNVRHLTDKYGVLENF